MQDLGKYDHGVEAIRLEDFTSQDTERQSGRLAKRNRHIDAQCHLGNRKENKEKNSEMKWKTEVLNFKYLYKLYIQTHTYIYSR